MLDLTPVQVNKLKKQCNFLVTSPLISADNKMKAFFILQNAAFHIKLGGCNIDGESERWDFGAGAGFYLDATQDKWKRNYRMYSYVTSEVLDTSTYLTIL